MQIGIFRPHEAGAMCLGRLRGAGEGAPKLATPKNGAVLGARGVNTDSRFGVCFLRLLVPLLELLFRHGPVRVGHALLC